MARPIATIPLAAAPRLSPRGGPPPYEALLEHGPDALLVVELGQPGYCLVNAAAERLLQFTRAELLRLAPDAVFDSADAPRLAELRRCVAAHAAWYGQLDLRRKDGSIVHTDAAFVQVVAGGRILIQGLFRDRTDQTRERWLQDALRRAQDIQHLLNNQLALITGYAEILSQDPRLPADLQEAAREALAGGLGAVEAGKLLIACFTADPR